MRIPFTKCSGCGNDFIIIDDREEILSKIDLPPFIKKICKRRNSIGADGVLIIEPDKEFPFSMRYFNSDSSEADFCGNGARCVALYGFKQNIVSKNSIFSSKAGIHKAVIGERIAISLPPPSEIKLNLKLEELPSPLHYIKILVPHTVIFFGDISTLGKKIRSHPEFQPEGTNVNFVELAGPSLLRIRTYERGIEGETPACGTGAVASSVIAFSLKKVSPPVRCIFKGGELWVKFPEDLSEVWLEGNAELTFNGEVEYEETPLGSFGSPDPSMGRGGSPDPKTC